MKKCFTTLDNIPILVPSKTIKVKKVETKTSIVLQPDKTAMMTRRMNDSPYQLIYITGDQPINLKSSPLQIMSLVKNRNVLLFVTFYKEKSF